MKHVYMLFAAIALEVTGTTFMKFSVMHEWLIGYPVTHQRCLRSLGRHWPYGYRLYCLDYF